MAYGARVGAMSPVLVSLATLLMGIALGWLAQRSRICFIGGLRDFLLVRDTDLLKGAVAFFVTAWLAFSVAGFFGLVDWRAPNVAAAAPAASGGTVSASQTTVGGALAVGWPVLATAASAGLTLGLFSTLANGCPTRQHVLAGQGMRDSLFYLVGFYGGVIVYNLITRPLLALLL